MPIYNNFKISKCYRCRLILPCPDALKDHINQMEECDPILDDISSSLRKFMKQSRIDIISDYFTQHFKDNVTVNLFGIPGSPISLKYLILDHTTNDIILTENLFDSLTSLEYLESDSFPNIPEKVLDKLTNLRCLYLRNNKNISMNVFDKLVNLKYLFVFFRILIRIYSKI